MIILKPISDEIITLHWEYFQNSSGYELIHTYSIDPNISPGERKYFKRLLRESVLKNIIGGKTEVLKREIEYFKTNLTKQITFLRWNRIFSRIGRWNEIHDRINTKAQELEGKEKIQKRREHYRSRLNSLINKINLETPQNLQINIPVLKKSVTIIYLEDLFKKIVDFLKIVNDMFKERILSIFNYSSFIDTQTDNKAYIFTQKLGINVCPYCNMNYIFTNDKGHGKTRPELDHFFPKSLYPYLAISLYNLIPSCHICNSNLKKAIDFHSEKHLHPYENNNYLDYQFKIKYTSDNIKTIIPTIDEFEITIENQSENQETQEKIKNSNRTFKLEELYNYHKDVAQEIIAKEIYYNKTKIEELKKIFGDFDNEFIKRIILGNYLNLEDIGKRSLAKFTYDLVYNSSLKSLFEND